MEMGVEEETRDVEAANVLQEVELTPVVTDDDNDSHPLTRKLSPRSGAGGLKSATVVEGPEDDLARRKQQKEDKHLTSDGRAFLNTIISFLGSGVLGLPYAFRRSGILVGLFTLIAVSAISTYCMLLILRCKYKLKSMGKDVSKYGDIGSFAMGKTGRVLVESALVISQSGFCVAYLIFIASNANKFLGVAKELVVSVCAPPLIAFSMLKHMKELAIFSLLADITTFVGLAVVYMTDFSYMPLDSDEIEVVGAVASIPFFFGVASYCFEGVGMVLPLENSMRNKSHFIPILVSTIVIITSIYATFGICGYLAFGNSTLDVLTLNMEGNSGMATLVKLFLCIGLFFTYPLMLFPVFEVLQPAFLSVCRIPDDAVTRERAVTLLRAAVVLLTAVVAAGVPNFGHFISFIGSTCCALLAFVLPTYFYWQLFREDMRQRKHQQGALWVVLEQSWLLLVFGMGVCAIIMGVAETLR